MENSPEQNRKQSHTTLIVVLVIVFVCLCLCCCCLVAGVALANARSMNLPLPLTPQIFTMLNGILNGNSIPPLVNPGVQQAITPESGLPQVNQGQSCLSGTWKVDPVSYINWMNRTIYKVPEINFTGLEPAFLLTVNPDGMFSVQEDNVVLAADVLNPSTGNKAGTIETTTTGGFNGTYTLLPPESGVDLLSFAVQNSTVEVLDVKLNGISINIPMNIAPLFDEKLLSKVGFVCEGDILTLAPIASGLPEQGFVLNRFK